MCVCWGLRGGGGGVIEMGRVEDNIHKELDTCEATKAPQHTLHTIQPAQNRTHTGGSTQVGMVQGLTGII